MIADTKRSAPWEEVKINKTASTDLVFASSQLLLPNIVNFIPTAQGIAIFMLIFQKTLRFGKYSEFLSLNDFRRGIPGAGVMGVGYKLSSIRNIRVELRELGLINYGASPGHNKSEYLINVPGIWREIKPYVDLSKPGEICRMGRALDNSASHLRDHHLYDPDIEVKGWGNRMKNIDDMIQEGREKSEDGLARRRKKQMSRPFRANIVGHYMRECCEELDRTYVEDWTGKSLRSAKNFIVYCERDMEKDPRKVLREVCEFWSDFKATMRDDHGNLIVLPDTISFWKFFQYRSQILNWLETEKKSVLEARGRFDYIDNVVKMDERR